MAQSELDISYYATVVIYFIITMDL